VQVATFSELPNAGDYFEVVSKDQLRKAKPQIKTVSKPGFKDKAINLIVKADTNSSKEALEDAIKKLSKKIDHIDFHLVASGVGDIGERDVQLASHTGSSIIGLHVKATNAVQAAQKEGVSIALFDIIYKLLEELEKRAEGAKEIKMIDKKVGEGVIRKVFDIKKIGIIAGCYVKEGIFSKNGKMVVWRNKQKIGSGAITSLQREGKNIKEVHAGFECAFMADGLIDFAVDDRVECYISVPDNKN
jgi:translation initiation factor IF-2